MPTIEENPRSATIANPLALRESLDGMSARVMDFTHSDRNAAATFPNYATMPRLFLYETKPGSLMTFSALLVVPLRPLTEIAGWRSGVTRSNAWRDGEIAVFAISRQHGLLYQLCGMAEAIKESQIGTINFGECARHWLSGNDLHGIWRLAKRIHIGAEVVPLLARGEYFSLPDMLVKEIAGSNIEFLRRKRCGWVNCFPGGMNEVAEALWRIEETVIYSTFDAFTSRLNRYVVQGLLEQRGYLHPGEYNWVADSALARCWQYRLDALRVLPALVTNLSDSVLPPRRHSLRKPGADERARQAIKQTIDEGHPLIARIAGEFGIAKVTVRAFLNVPPEWAPELVEPPGGIRQMLRWLNALPPERFPRERKEWLEFCYLAAEAHAVAETFPGLAWRAKRTYIEETVPGWLVRISKKGFPPAALQFRAGLCGIASLADAKDMTDVLLHMKEAGGMSSKTLYKVMTLLSRKTPASWRDMCVTWHRRLQVERVEVSEMEEHITAWQAIAPAMKLHGVYINPLVSQSDLACEGAEMHHCIGSYDVRVMLHREQVFSLQGETRAERSTLLVGYLPDPDSRDRARILQHRGVFNIPPLPQCKKAADDLIKWLNSGDATAHLIAAEAARKEREGMHAEIVKGSKNFFSARAALLEALPADVLRLLANGQL